MPTFLDLISAIAKFGPAVVFGAALIYVVLYGELQFRYPRKSAAAKASEFAAHGETPIVGVPLLLAPRSLEPDALDLVKRQFVVRSFV